MLAKALQQAAGNALLPDIAEAVDFDGANDYLSRASDLTGNADGKTFTFSCWVWNGGDNGYVISDLNNYIYLNIGVSGDIAFFANNAAGIQVLRVTAVGAAPVNTWTNILFSADLTSATNRSFYVNGAIVSPSWATYVNDNIDWTRTSWGLMARSDGATGFVKSRLSHVFLDYTYRDLSIEANRRLFITADRKPAAGQAALNPILYMKLDDPTTAHINSGTGGNFTLNGTVARSGRGPNQFNAPYSDLNGSAQSLSRASALSGLSDGNTFTFQCCFSYDSFTSGAPRLIANYNGYFQVFVGNSAASGRIEILGTNSSGTLLLNVATAVGLVPGRNYVLSISIDLSSTDKRHIYINGTSVTATWTVYTNGTIQLDRSANGPLGVGYQPSGTSSSWLDGRLGNVFFHTSYIDLSSPANLAKFVTGTGIDAKPVDLGANGELPFGTPPLIYLPMYGNNAGKNYGSGGDFTVNSGPYTGARGPNEFWGNKAAFDGASSTSLSRTSALAGVSDGKVFSLSYYHDAGSTNLYNVTLFNTSGYGFRFGISSGTLVCDIVNTAGTQILRFTATGTYNTGYFQICIDLANTSNRFVYFNGVAQSVTWTTYANTNIQWTSFDKPSLNSYYNPGGSNFLGQSATKLSEVYLSTAYVDFSQEANRLKFRDAFGNPVALLPQIEAGTLPTPAMYMRFDPANQGKNDGTGGDFTKSGTITDGGQL